MIKLMKLAALLLVFNFAISCRFWPNTCPDSPYESSSGKIKFEEYYRDYFPYTEKFAFYEDSSFSYLKIVYKNNENDTIEKLNGKFKTYKDHDFPWHILKLNGDSIYQKQIIKDTLNGNSYFSSDFTAAKFLGFSDSLLTDKGVFADSSWNVDSTCFVLSEKYYDNFYNYCNDGYYSSSPYRTFCLKQPEETPEQKLNRR